VRVLAWTFAWTMIASMLTRILDWPFWTQVAASTLAATLAIRATANESLRWRWVVLRNWGRLQRPLVLNEDGDVHGAILPFEILCLTGDERGICWGHIHSRTLVLGRERLRAQTRWRDLDA